MVGLIGKKIGMTRFFDEAGRDIPVTVIEAGPCCVTQIKTGDNNGYRAVQLGFGPKKAKRVNKPLLGHFNKAGVNPTYILREFRDFDGMESLKLGDQIKVDIFSPGDLVMVTGKSKGRGFTGAIKRHGFHGGPKTHGQSDRWRAPGSVGGSSFPSRVFKGTRMAGRMGNERVTLKNLQVVKVDVERNLLLVAGAVPGAKNAYLEVRKQSAS